MMPRDWHHGLPGPLYLIALQRRLATADFGLIAQTIQD